MPGREPYRGPLAFNSPETLHVYLHDAIPDPDERARNYLMLMGIAARRSFLSDLLRTDLEKVFGMPKQSLLLHFSEHLANAVSPNGNPPTDLQLLNEHLYEQSHAQVELRQALRPSGRLFSNHSFRQLLGDFVKTKKSLYAGEAVSLHGMRLVRAMSRSIMTASALMFKDIAWDDICEGRPLGTYFLPPVLEAFCEQAYWEETLDELVIDENFYPRNGIPSPIKPSLHALNVRRLGRPFIEKMIALSQEPPVWS